MNWTRGHTLGRGSTATVYVAEARESGQMFAVKSAELHRSEFLEKEKGILENLNCPQIVAYQGCDTTFENGVYWYNLFMEYAPHGTLADAIRGGGMEEGVVGSYARQILLGLNYLHYNGIVHCDVKGKNVLVTEQGVKIADFGCARSVEESLVIAGTPVFMAPEVARGEEQSYPADVWALGCTVLEMITGKLPWDGVSDPAAALYRIGFSSEVPEIPSFVSEQGKDFLRKCLNRDPNERWTVEKLLGHGFVKESKELLWFDSDITPKCVLERGFWDSLETTHDLPIESPNDSDSVRNRIRRLFGDEEPNWEFDDDEQWVTVRSNEKQFELETMSIEETDTVSIFSDQGNDFVILYETEDLDAGETELGRGNVIIDDCFCFSSSSSNCNCCCKESLLVCSCLKIVPPIKFDSNDKEFFSIHCFLLCSRFSLFHFTLDELALFKFLQI